MRERIDGLSFSKLKAKLYTGFICSILHTIFYTVIKFQLMLPNINKYMVLKQRKRERERENDRQTKRHRDKERQTHGQADRQVGRREREH